MTKEEAKKVCNIMLEADGGCSFCANWLLKSFACVFPEHKDIADAAQENPEEFQCEPIPKYESTSEECLVLKRVDEEG